MDWRNECGQIGRDRFIRLTCSHNKLICSTNMPAQHQRISLSNETVTAGSKLLTQSSQSSFFETESLNENDFIEVCTRRYDVLLRTGADDHDGATGRHNRIHGSNGFG